MTDPAHERIASLIQAITDCMQPGHLPAVDLADLRTMFEGGGRIEIGIGHATGESRAEHAALSALRDFSKRRDDFPPSV